MLSAMESMLTCLVTNVRTLLPSVLSKTSTSHTKHNFLKRRKKKNKNEDRWAANTVKPLCATTSDLVSNHFP